MTTYYTMAQLRVAATGYDAHFTRRTDDRESPPRIRSHRNISAASICRFLAVSGGYRAAYSEKPPRREHELIW